VSTPNIHSDSERLSETAFHDLEMVNRVAEFEAELLSDQEREMLFAFSKLNCELIFPSRH
jgi:hypothetical protein